MKIIITNASERKILIGVEAHLKSSGGLLAGLYVTALKQENKGLSYLAANIYKAAFLTKTSTGDFDTVDFGYGPVKLSVTLSKNENQDFEIDVTDFEVKYNIELNQSSAEALFSSAAVQEAFELESSSDSDEEESASNAPTPRF